MRILCRIPVMNCSFHTWTLGMQEHRLAQITQMKVLIMQETLISADYTYYTDEGLIMQETQISADDGVDNSRNTD